MEIIYGAEKKNILKQLNEQYGITSLPYLLIKFGAEKIRAYSGDFSTEELRFLAKNIIIENIGLYILNVKEGARLTFDGVSLFKGQISKNILEIDDNQAKEWLKGNDLVVNLDRGFFVIRYKDEFIGCGKSTGEKITNFVPKERRIRN
jgi:NOL1/NOP2/fmu family ribosome biogenesis protein